MKNAVPARLIAFLSASLSVFLFASLFAGPPAASAAEPSGFDPEKGFGVGLVVGSPSGLTASLPLNDGANAVNATAGYSFGRNDGLALQADYVWVRSGILPVEQGAVAFYYGPGAFLRASGHPAAGVRIALGVDYRFARAPLQAFLEIAPGVNVIPDTDVNAAAGLGIRYYF